MSKKAQLISVMSELGAGTRGASLGFDALKIASLKYQPNFFGSRSVNKVATFNSMLHETTELKSAIRIDGISRMYALIEDEVSSTINNGYFPIVFTGDHSNAGGTIAGIKKAHPNKRLGVIWVDAHADLHSPYTSPTGNVHGMPLGTALGSDNKENQVVEPKPMAVEHWGKMKGDKPRISPKDLFFIGVRDTEAPEEKLMEKHSIPNVMVADARKQGMKQTAKQALDYLKECDIIYVSFDVDSMDPSVSRGTGTPVENGLMEEEAKELLLELVTDKRLCAFETTEINPLLDTENKMAEAAFRVVAPVIEKIEANL